MHTVPVGSLQRLLATLDYRRPAVAAHSRRVAVFARHLGVIMGLPSVEMEALVQAALVHEAGALVGRTEGGSHRRSHSPRGSRLLTDVTDQQRTALASGH